VALPLRGGALVGIVIEPRTREMTLVRIDPTTGAASPIMRLPRNLIGVIATDYAGSRLFFSAYHADTNSYGVDIVNVGTGTVTRTALPLRDYAFYDEASGELITAIWAAGLFTITSIHPVTGVERPVATFASAQPVHSWAFDPARRLLYFSRSDFFLRAANVDTGAVLNTGLDMRFLTSATFLDGRLLALQISDTHLERGSWTIVHVEPEAGRITPLVPLGPSLQFWLDTEGVDRESGRLLVREQLDRQGRDSLSLVDVASGTVHVIPGDLDSTFNLSFVAHAAHTGIPMVGLPGILAIAAGLLLVALRALRA
jgi:hypothetical protein